MKKNKFLYRIFILFILTIMLAGCGSKKEKNTSKKNDKVVEKKEVSIIDVNSKSRPIAVMIDNSSDARAHQHGLQKAYMVYEILNYIDGRTRFMALYKDTDVERLSPIRSTRVYHIDYILENDAIFVHWGYSPQAESDIKNLKINNINGLIYGNTYFWTPEGEGTDVSHKRCTSTELINNAIEKFNYNKESSTKNLFEYSGDRIVNNDELTTDANNITLTYAKNNVVGYIYDEKNDIYLRNINNEPHIDMATENQISVKNIIIYQIKNSTIAGDDSSRQELHNIGKGTGYFITGGKSNVINWSKECRECQTKYTYSNGDEIILNDGNTFIQIVPTSGSVVIY